MISVNVRHKTAAGGHSKATGVLLVTVITSLLCVSAYAKTPPWPSASVSIHAQEQPLDEFLQDLFSATGLRVLSSNAVAGRVSGHFDDPPEVIFSHLVKAYGLLPYFDGTVMHVSSAQEITQHSVKLSQGDLERVLHALVAQQLTDAHQTITVLRDQRLIKFRGAPEFIADVQELIRYARQPATRARPVRTAPMPAPTPPPPAAAVGNPVIFKTFRLRYASATDLTFFQNGREVTVPGVASLLRSMMGIGGSLLASSSSNSPQHAYNVPSLRGRGLRGPDPRNPISQGPSQPRERAGMAPQSTLAADAVDRDRVTRIEADASLNAVIVRDYREAMSLYQGLIQELDVEPLLVEIKVTIVDVDRGSLSDIGVDWQYNDQRNDIRFGGGNPGLDPLAQTGGLLLNTVLGNSGHFLARVNALAQNGSAQLISRPQVLTLSNLEAVLTTDQSFFVRVAGNEDVDLFNVSVGTALRVVPNVVGDPDDPQIRLLVTIEDGSLSPDRTVDEIPVVERSSLNTQAIIYDGESLLLGGLVREASAVTTTKVPILGDVPGVGRLFRRDEKTEQAQERLFMISPRIVVNQRGGGRRFEVPAPATDGAPQRRLQAPPERVEARADTHNPVAARRRPEGYLDGF